MSSKYYQLDSMTRVKMKNNLEPSHYIKKVLK